MGFESIHETALSDALEIIKSGAGEVADALAKPQDVAKSSSLTRYTKGLILVFPVLASKSNHIESVGIVAKAIEAKAVTLLQLALSAANITSSKSGLDYIQQFHTNLDFGKMNLDDFIDVMDNYVGEGAGLTADEYKQYKAVTEDLRNISYCLGDDINERGLNEYALFKQPYREGYQVVVKEANDKDRKDLDDELTGNTNDPDIEKDLQQNDTLGNKAKAAKVKSDSLNARVGKISAREKILNDRDKLQLDKDKFEYQKDQEGRKLAQQKAQDKFRRNQDKKDLEYKKERDRLADEARERQERLELMRNRLISSDVKKANELVPTMMVINFKLVDEKSAVPVDRSMVIGVKAKIYEVEPADVINKIITQHIDSNVLLKLIKASTREISFVRDFLFAINDAKLDALSKSRRGSTNKLFKVLERRSLKGKIGKALKMRDYFKAISTLVISQEEVEELLKNNIDVSNPRIIRPIMEKLNLMCFVIIDESSESAKFIFDTGDDIYETIPFSQLEREQKDGMSRKVINLIAKMNR